jgi:predicted GNAT family N-acyltransferase
MSIIYNYTPILLKDKSRLQEIYDLRVTAYEDSPKSVYVNKELFPNGWKDHLDEVDNTYHFVVIDNQKIVASGRIAIVDDVYELTDLKEALDMFELPKEKPVAYLSRLVVHKEYRKRGIPDSMDRFRLNFLKENKMAKFAIGCATNDRQASLLKYGFVNLGTCHFKFLEDKIIQEQSFFCNYLTDES